MGTHRWISVKGQAPSTAEQLSQQGALVSPQQIEGLSEFEKRFDVGDAIDTCFAEVRALGWDDGKDNEFKFEDHHDGHYHVDVQNARSRPVQAMRLFDPATLHTIGLLYFLWALIIISTSAAATSDDDDHSI